MGRRVTLYRWRGEIADTLGACEVCRGTGRTAYGPWGSRPPTKECDRCGGTGVDPEGMLAGTVPEDNGLLIERKDGWDVYVARMIVNYRILLSRTGDDYNVVAGFCYSGTGDGTLVKAIAAAQVWAQGDVIDSDPVGYVKVAFDGRDHAYWLSDS